MDSYVIYPNGETVPAVPRRTRTDDDDRFRVSQLQDIVGGYIGIVDIGDRVIIYNDEGDLNDLPINATATGLAKSNPEWKGYIAGPAVVCGRNKIRV